MKRTHRFAKDEAMKAIYGSIQDYLNEEPNENDTITIIPPAVDTLTDDENDDDVDNDNLPIDVAGTVEVVNALSEDPETSEQSDKKQKKEAVTWENGEKDMSVHFQEAEDLEKLEDMFPLLVNHTDGELFSLFFNEAICKHIIKESKRYANMKNDHNFNFGTDDLHHFLAIIFISGYNQRQQEWMYWSKEKDIECPIISSIMSSKRFKSIKRFLHFNDNNNLDPQDKLSKIRPLLDLANDSLGQFGIFSKQLSVDEQMIPYFGRNSCKMFIKSKPIRFGYKSWVICSNEGYPFKFEIYQGAQNKPENSPLGSRVVHDLINPIKEFKNHQIYFDNFFCSYDLLCELRQIGLRSTGTIRVNRCGKCPLLSEKDLKRGGRGTFQCFHSENVKIIQWQDNRAVTIGTNFDSLEPIKIVQRYDRKNRERVNVSQPQTIANYNRYMGGVDLLDNALSNIRPSIKSRKWYFPIVINTFRTLLIASWKFSILLGKKSSQIDFTRNVVQYLMNKVPNVTSKPGPSGEKCFLSIQDKHILERADKQLRCRVCKKNSRHQCRACCVNLHLNCFEKYHA